MILNIVVVVGLVSKEGLISADDVWILCILWFWDLYCGWTIGCFCLHVFLFRLGVG